MKKLLYLAAVCAALMSCKTVYKDEPHDNPGRNDSAYVDENGAIAGAPVKHFTFTMKGQFSQEYKALAPSRAASQEYLSANTALTDLFVIDYTNGAVAQTLHQTSTDADWGTPALDLTYGTHHIYFVATKGTAPTLSGTTLTFTKTHDTYYCDYEVTVVKTSNGNRAVTLNRAVSKLSVHITDKVPAGAAKLRISLSQGADALSVLTGYGTPTTISREWNCSTDAGTVVPSWAVYTLCPSDEEWTATVTMQYLASDGSVLYTRTAEDVSLMLNRETILTGTMVEASNGFTLALNTDWQTPVEVEF